MSEGLIYAIKSKDKSSDSVGAFLAYNGKHGCLCLFVNILGCSGLNLCGICSLSLSLLAETVVADMDSDCSCKLNLKSNNLFFIYEAHNEKNHCGKLKECFHYF